jgi:glycerol kinase
VLESTAQGAAYMAGLATGVWKNTKEIEKNREIDRVFKPNMSADEREKHLSEWSKAVERSMHWATEE